MVEPGSEVWDAIRDALSGTHRTAPIERTVRDENPPLSYAQEGIWLHEQLFPKGGAFNTTLAIEIDGPLDVGSLTSALDAIIRRHEILRTSIVAANGIPHQKVSREVAIQLRQRDLSQLKATERLAEIERLALANNMVPFELSQPPLWRFELVRLAAASHVLLLTVHHIVWDQSSYSVWLGELAELVADVGSSVSAARSELAVQHADFASWERREADSGRLESQIEYWRTKLEGCEWHLELPRDRPRPQVPTFAGRSRWIRFDDSLRTGLEELSRRAGTTLFMTMLGGFASLLARYGNASELVIGAPFSKRYRTELRPLIGPLVNLLLLPLNVSEDPTVGELLERVRAAVTEAYTNQEAPYELVTATMRPDRERSGGPRVQTMFTFYRMPPRETTAGALELRPLDVDDGKARMDLELYVWVAPDGLHARFIFDADIFNAETTERVTQHYANVLAGMVADSSCRLSELPLLDEEERHKLLVEWSGRSCAGIPDGTIHELFEAQVERAPEATALIAAGQSLSYAELDELANRLAGHLHRRGIGAGSLVAVHLEREPGLISALLAILKLGAAYVPLDLADPPERTMLMLADSGATLLLTTVDRREQLGDNGVDVLTLDEIRAAPGAERPPPVSSAPLAYVTYTSGSTGTPKGIVVPHGAVLDSVIDTDYLTLAPGDRIAQAANISFDVATVEIWGALLNGATMVMLPHDTILAPSTLAAELETQHVDTLFLTTALFHRVATEAPSAFRGLRDLLVGGEVLDGHWVRRVLSHGAPQRLLNVYGPTETTAYSTWYQIDGVIEEGPRVPIGRPIGRTRVYVLDDSMQPVPVGVAGELYLGGPSLASGYLGRPDLTAERFVSDPFGADQNGRLYRTGDRVRYRTDGNLEFLDRIDDQVKIRGNRIELGEIEAALALHPNVRECAVVVSDIPERDGVPRDKRLIAYVVATEEQLPELAELRRFLKQRLPPYMVPAAFVSITAIPLTPSGKVDRLALGKRGHPRPSPSEAFVAPHNDIERTLAQIWKRVLWLEEDVGIHDDFFELGGHSLLAAVMVTEVEKAFDAALPVGALFRLTTISELAGHLEPMVEALTESLARGLTHPEPEEVVKPHPLAGEIHHRLLAFTAGWHGQRVAPDGGLMVGLNLGGHEQPLFWCLQSFDELQQLATHLGDSRPVYGMRSGHLAMQFSVENIRALAAHYVGEVLATEPHGPYLIGGNCQGAYIAWAIAEELRRRGHSVPLLALQLFDYRHALPYGGRVALFFGADAADRFRASGAHEPAWFELFPAGFSLDVISGTNRWHFVEPHIQDFASKLDHRIVEALAAVAERPSAPRGRQQAGSQSHGVVVLGIPGSRPSRVTGLLRHLWSDDVGTVQPTAERRIAAIHNEFLEALGRTWDDPRPFGRDDFAGTAAAGARAQLCEVVDQLAGCGRWTIDDPRMCRLLPLWDGLFLEHSEVHYLHLLEWPGAVVEVLAEREGFPTDKSLLLWLMYALDAEAATRDSPRSWIRLEALAAPPRPNLVKTLRAVAGQLDHLERRLTEGLEAGLGALRNKRGGSDETDFEALRFHPWAAAAYRALVGFTEGREVESRIALDALRFGLDEDRRFWELDRVQGESDRLREKSHHVWQESVRAREENQRLRREIDDLRRANSESEHSRQSLQQQLHDLQQRRSWKLMAPLRWCYSLLRGRCGSR